MRSWYVIDFNAALMVNEFNSLFASFIHAKRCFIVLISLSTKLLARWSFAGAGIKVILFFEQKLFTWLPIRQRAWSILKERGPPWVGIYLSKNFFTIDALAFSKISAEGYFENLSIHVKIYISCSFSLIIGPAKSICISWFGTIHGVCALNCSAGITGFKFLPMAVQDLHSMALTSRSRFIYGHQQCWAIPTIPQLPVWLACRSSISASLRAFGLATFSSIHTLTWRSRQ